MRDLSLKQPRSSAGEQEHGCNFVNRNIRVGARRTSIRLERALWQACDDILEREGMTLRALCCVIDDKRNGANLTAALRLFIIHYFRMAAAAIPAPPRLAAQDDHGFRESRASPLLRAALQALE